MAKVKMTSDNKNFLPILSIGVLVMSVLLASSNGVLSFGKDFRNVLSKSDEVEIKSESESESNKEDERKEEKENEKEKEKVEAKSEVKKEISSGKIKINEIEDNDENEVEVENEIEDANSDEIETEFEQESETASSDGTINKFKFKLKTKTINGKTIIETASGEMEVENSPEDAVNSLIDDKILDTPTSFEAKTNDNNEVEFEVQGTETKKLLGLFEVVLPKTVTIDAETGDIINLNQSIWAKFLSLLSV